MVRPPAPGLLAAMILLAACSPGRADDAPRRPKTAEASEPRDDVPARLGEAGGSALAVTLARADVALMRSAVRPNLLKGGFGERHMGRHFAGGIRRAGGWSPMSARLGPQGLDGLYVRFGADGHPARLLVAESKYGASQLKMTADGLQMGKPWRAARLGRMAGEYRSIAGSIESGQMKVAGPGGSVGSQRIEFPLGPGSKAAVFARARPGDPWEFVGPRRLMGQAGRQARVLGDYLQLAADDRVAHDARIYRATMKGGTLSVAVKDASALGAQGTESALPVEKRIESRLNPRRLAALRGMARVEVAEILWRKFPGMSAADAEHYARQVVRTDGDLERLFSPRPETVRGAMARASLKAGGSLALVDAGLQAIGSYREAGSVDWGRVGASAATTFASTYVGTRAGQGAVVFMTENPVARQFMTRSSTVLGLGSRGLATNLVGGALGGGVSMILMSYGGYLAGLHDIQTAKRMMIAEGSGMVAGMVFTSGLSAAVATFGTASSGAAISSLSGAAATSATAAWFGGGSLSAGGLGAVTGGAILTGGGILIAMGTSAAIYATFSYIDRAKEYDRIRLTLGDLASRESFPTRAGGHLSVRSVRIGGQ